MIEINKHPSGRLSNFLFGITAIADGLVRVFSCGFLHTRFTVEWASYQVRMSFRKAKEKRQREQNVESKV